MTAADSLRRIAELSHQIASDLAALPDAMREESAPFLASVTTRLQALAADLRARHAGAVATQLAALGPRLDGELWLALTGTAPAPWISVGHPPAEVVLNLGRGLPFVDGSARYVYFALALEHFHFPGEARFLARELRRVLRPDGAVRIVVPDLGAYARAYAAGDDAFFAGHVGKWPWAERVRTAMEYLQVMSGAGPGRAPGDFFGHKVGYDFDTLALVLRDAGFGRVERVAYGVGPDPALILDGYSHDAGFACGDVSYSLFVEARP